MFNLSFGEILLILVLAILFIKPSDFPVVLKNVKAFFNKFLALKAQVMEQIEQVKDDIQDLEDDLLANDKIIKKDDNKGEEDGK